MTTRFIPLVLNNTLLPDGEHAFLLSLRSNDFGSPEVPLYAEPQPPRASRMRMAGILQIDLDDTPKPAFVMTVRSPYPANQGLVTMSPVCAGRPVDSNLLDRSVRFYPTNPNSLVPADYPLAGDIVPGNYLPSFNGKPIPNWVFSIVIPTHEEGSNGSYWITCDFMHSIP